MIRRERKKMFQSGKVRELSEEKHICSTCNKKESCTIELGKAYQWRYILTYCQEFKGE
jgi:hypothetical protein